MPAAFLPSIISPADLQSWTLLNEAAILAVNKPAHIICHPSKNGPASSLVGACRLYYACDRLHMPSRLDRETSGIVVMAKDSATASRLQRAIMHRRAYKTYIAILNGELQSPQTVDLPIGPDTRSEFISRQAVEPTGKPAVTEFIPLTTGGGFTIVRVHPHTGRRHQIRVHAAHIGHPVTGDKLYPDADLMMEYIRNDWSTRLQSELPLRRQALHASEIVFETEYGHESFRAPLTSDLQKFCSERMNVDAETLCKLQFGR